MEKVRYGIIGFGKIGKAVAVIARAFGMKVLAHTNHPAPFDDVEFVTTDELLGVEKEGA